jgi:hypothetical protein
LIQQTNRYGRPTAVHDGISQGVSNVFFWKKVYTFFFSPTPFLARGSDIQTAPLSISKKLSHVERVRARRRPSQQLRASSAALQWHGFIQLFHHLFKLAEYIMVRLDSFWAIAV